ncbi:DUF4345 domain-containing protein [Phaeobacter sp. C3_T13_0]|uniref:DUF4345 domain-containing protein n=1 Tax=Phaeobacter cretensis TaxID=3342641 RepID=UPI0039BCC042
MSFYQKFTLSAAGLTACSIGLAITFATHGFYAGYGIDLGENRALLSELRAPGANLAILGAVIFTGVLRPGLARLSAALGTLVFFAYASGRIVGIVLDGWPGESILVALAIELIVGSLCLFELQRQNRPFRGSKISGHVS